MRLVIDCGLLEFGYTGISVSRWIYSDCIINRLGMNDKDALLWSGFRNLQPLLRQVIQNLYRTFAGFFLSCSFKPRYYL